MAGFLRSVATVAVAAFTAGGAMVVSASEVEARPLCEQRAQPRVDASSHGLSPEEAARLLQSARELVTALSKAAGDARAARLDADLRSMGITPAVARGWRQQAHDLADALVIPSETDAHAMRMAVGLARAGFTPTPADLQRPLTVTSAALDDPAPPTADGSATDPGPHLAAAFERAEIRAREIIADSEDEAPTPDVGAVAPGAASPSKARPGKGTGTTKADPTPRSDPGSSDAASDRGTDTRSTAPREQTEHPEADTAPIPDLPPATGPADPDHGDPTTDTGTDGAATRPGPGTSASSRKVGVVMVSA